MSSRSAKTVLLMLMLLLFWALVSRSRNRLMKWCMWGRTIATWPSRPTFCFISFVVVFALSIISLISADQALYLFSGSDMIKRQRSKSQPRIIFISSSPASALSLFSAAISSRGIGSFACFGQAAA